jgi:serine/threonine protein kinase
LELTYLDYITGNQNLKERQIKAVMFQVFKAIYYMHEEHSIAHRDIKLENIMIIKDKITERI